MMSKAKQVVTSRASAALTGEQGVLKALQSVSWIKASWSNNPHSLNKNRTLWAFTTGLWHKLYVVPKNFLFLNLTVFIPQISKQQVLGA